MKSMKMTQPTEAELEILQILWQHGPNTVRFINDRLNENKQVGYTTTLKLMQIMTEKNILKRDKQQRSHLYSPVDGEHETQQRLLDRLMQTAFGGSSLKLVMQALGNHKASKEEISRIRDLLDQMEQ
jgi:BlaI family transcriptional regulator, penicillinase repressor